MVDKDEKYMRRALELADVAGGLGETPVGAVVVCGGKIVGEGYNRRETDKRATLHAEIIAIEEACRSVGDWRLSECEIYVTLEPCPMCAGAILNARMKRVIYGAADEKYGCCGGYINLFEFGFWSRPAIKNGVLAEECEKQLRMFFEGIREKQIEN